MKWQHFDVVDSNNVSDHISVGLLSFLISFFKHIQIFLFCKIKVVFVCFWNTQQHFNGTEEYRTHIYWNHLTSKPKQFDEKKEKNHSYVGWDFISPSHLFYGIWFKCKDNIKLGGDFFCLLILSFVCSFTLRKYVSGVCLLSFAWYNKFMNRQRDVLKYIYFNIECRSETKRNVISSFFPFSFPLICLLTRGKTVNICMREWKHPCLNVCCIYLLFY